MRVFALLPGILIGAIVVACSGNTADIPQPTASLTPSVTPSPITIESTPPVLRPGPTPRPLPTSMASPTPVPPTATPEMTPTATPTTPATPSPSTPIVLPTATPAPTPSPTPTASPTPSPTATPSPTLTPIPKINLRPVSPGAGQLPLSVHAQPGSTEPGDLRTGRIAYLDWFFENDSPFPTEGEFESHVYVDGVFVSKWISSQAPPFQTFGIRDWSELNDRVRLGRGEHVFKVIIDALDQIPESDESDNVFERTLMWGGEPLIFPDAAARSVNLVIAPAMDRSEAVVIAATAGSKSSGPVTVDATTFITWGAKNAGLASIDTSIAVHVYFDGLLVDQRVIPGISALSRSELIDWDELGGKIRITPGEHTLKISVDPGNLVDESDETDNSVTTTLTWGTGPAVAPEPSPEPMPIPAPAFDELTRPNLVTYLPLDWDAPLVVRGTTSGASIEGRNGHVPAFTAGMVDYAITNGSPVSSLNSFNTRLLLDDIQIDESGFASGGPGGVWKVNITIPADRLTPGTHTLRLVIDSANEVTESDEGDNSFTWEFEAIAGAAPAPATPTTYSDDEIREMLAAIPDLMLQTANADDSTAASVDWLTLVTTVADAAYFLSTGTTLPEERIEISLLPRTEYEIQNLTICLENKDTLTLSEYETSLANCRATIGSSAGLTWSRSGVARIRVDASTTPAGVLATLLHELGHARQGILNPVTSSTIKSDARSAIGEAQAQMFEAVGMRHIEEFLGERFTQYPKLNVLLDDINALLDRRVERAADLEEHGLGYEVMWLGALQDVGGLGLAIELRTDGVLSATSALAYYNYLLTIDGQDPVSWVNARLAGGNSLIEEFREITLSRLVPALSPDAEGHPHLLDLAFLTP